VSEETESHRPAESSGARPEPTGRAVAGAALLLLRTLRQAQPLPQQHRALPALLLSF